MNEKNDAIYVKMDIPAGCKVVQIYAQEPKVLQDPSETTQQQETLPGLLKQGWEPRGALSTPLGIYLFLAPPRKTAG
jgi:hypothetical protein